MLTDAVTYVVHDYAGRQDEHRTFTVDGYLAHVLRTASTRTGRLFQNSLQPGNTVLDAMLLQHRRTSCTAHLSRSRGFFRQGDQVGRHRCHVEFLAEQSVHPMGHHIADAGMPRGDHRQARGRADGPG